MYRRSRSGRCYLPSKHGNERKWGWAALISGHRPTKLVISSQLRENPYKCVFWTYLYRILWWTIQSFWLCHYDIKVCCNKHNYICLTRFSILRRARCNKSYLLVIRYIHDHYKYSYNYFDVYYTSSLEFCQRGSFIDCCCSTNIAVCSCALRCVVVRVVIYTFVILSTKEYF